MFFSSSGITCKDSVLHQKGSFKKEKMEADAIKYEEAAAKAKANGDKEAYNTLIEQAEEYRKNIADEDSKLKKQRHILTQAERYTSTLEGNIMSMFNISPETAA